MVTDVVSKPEPQPKILLETFESFPFRYPVHRSLLSDKADVKFDDAPLVRPTKDFGAAGSSLESTIRAKLTALDWRYIKTEVCSSHLFSNSASAGCA